MTLEQNLNHWIQGALEKCDVVRIESTTENGIPDMSTCHMGIEAWIECKIIHGWKVLLRKEQYAWGSRRTHHGGNICLIAYDPKHDKLFGYRFPLVAMPEGDNKYVRVESEPDFVIIRSDPASKILLKKFLYPGT